MYRALVLFMALIALATPAYADNSECTSRVYDYTGKANTDAIKDSLKPLIADGADPMVRIVTAAQINAAGNLDKYANNMLKRCSSWQSPGGNIKNNLLVLALTQDPSIESPIGIYFSKGGPLSALHGKTAAVRSEMASTLKSDIAVSISNGVQAMHGKLSVAKTRAAETRIVSNGPTTIINQAPSKPMNLTFLWVLLGLAMVGVGVWLYLKKKSAEAVCRAAQQMAQTRRGQCNNLLLGFESKLAQLGALLSSFKSTLHADEFTALQTRLGNFTTRITTAKGQFANLQGSANDPDSSGRTAAEYDAMTADFNKSLNSIQIIDSDIHSLEASIRKIKSLKDGATPAIDALASEIAKATTIVNAEKILNTNGPKATIQLAITLLERAQGAFEDKRFQAVADMCKEGTRLAQQAANDVRELGLRKQRIDEAIQKLENNNPSTKLITADTEISFLRNKYGEDAVTRASESRAVIVQNIDARRQAIEGAKSSSFAGSPSIVQNWNMADQYISTAMTADRDIDSAVSRIQGIGARIEEERRPSRSPSYRPSGGGSYRNRGSSHTTIVNQNTVVAGDHFYDPFNISLVNGLDAFGNALEREELREERRELDAERREMSRGWEAPSRRDDDFGMDGDCGAAVQSCNCFDGDSGPASEPSSPGFDGGSNDDD
jgi:hypothetical protein